MIERNITGRRTRDASRARVAAARGLSALVFASMLALPLAAFGAGQRTFATPEEAVSALSDALKAGDEAALISIFGDTHKSLVASPDHAENEANWAKASAELEAFHAFDDAGQTRRILLVGDEAWPMPIPLVKEGGTWRFATEQGEDEIINRRIGANEHEAIKVLRAYLDAQREYASRDRNHDGLLEYAQKLASTPGKQDGLYWHTDEDSDAEPSPFGPLVAASSEYLKGHVAGDPYRGYHFRILTRQGRHAPGGAFSYVINGHMLAGFAMVAYPARYGTSGVMTFVVNNNGVIYQKDRGAHAPPITEFDPDSSWQRVKDAL
ncbi:DUF2950 domain-containing protein [Paraburkholderia antibiotica]|uniref:DUF2950 domain-containing protein n=1 Tax=Paraburkholderia antibiotica TaxID=2728839 RepID=A0A7X9ZXN7_9BURK|nr:DUF2950 domain-containing protein [Paraburkholderia antibiotica]NML30533.1 DUF2950 domain-containing protein [Paraburkholderia antibiotica]